MLLQVLQSIEDSPNDVHNISAWIYIHREPPVLPMLSPCAKPLHRSSPEAPSDALTVSVAYAMIRRVERVSVKEPTERTDNLWRVRLFIRKINLRLSPDILHYLGTAVSM